MPATTLGPELVTTIPTRICLLLTAALIGCSSPPKPAPAPPPVSIEAPPPAPPPAPATAPKAPAPSANERRYDASTVPRTKVQCDGSPADGMTLCAAAFQDLANMMSQHPDVPAAIKRPDPAKDLAVVVPNADPAAFVCTITLRGDGAPFATMDLRLDAATPAPSTGKKNSLGPLRVAITRADDREHPRSAEKIMQLSLAMTGMRFKRACPAGKR